MISSLPHAILFDWDGVFVSDDDHIYESLAQTFQHFNVYLPSQEETMRTFGSSTRDAFPKYFKDYNEEARQYFYATHLQKPLDRLKITQDAEILLKILQEKKIYAAVVSNKRGDAVRAEAEHLAISSYFSRIVGSTDAPKDKPSTDPVFLALEGSGYHPGTHEVWFLGDREIDMICAYASGCTPIEVALSHSKIEDSSAYLPQLKIRSFQEIIKILK